MFEQALLTNRSRGKRLWTASLGLAGQAMVVGGAILASAIWPQALQTAGILEKFVPLVPPGPPRPENRTKPEVRHVPVSKSALLPLDKYQPSSIPTSVAAFVPEAPVTTEVVGGSSDGPRGSDVITGILTGLGMAPSAPKPPAVPAPAPKAPPEPAPTIQRYAVGGNVHLGDPLFKASPQYPAPARAARISGVVELECVVGIDGHIKEVRLKSGNPLLVRAATDAAWQWVYAPSKLNGVPIEIITVLSFNFKLN